MENITKKAECDYRSGSAVFVLLMEIAVIGAFGWCIFKIYEQDTTNVVPIIMLVGFIVIFAILFIVTLLLMRNYKWVFTEEQVFCRNLMGKTQVFTAEEIERCRKRSYPRQTFMEICFTNGNRMVITYHVRGFHDVWEFANQHYNKARN